MVRQLEDDTPRRSRPPVRGEAAPPRRRQPEPEPARRRGSRDEAPAPRTRRAAADAEPTTRSRSRSSRTSAAAAKPRRVRPDPHADVRPVREPLSKSEIYEYVAERANVDKRTARDVLDALNSAIVAHILPRGPAKFTMPGGLFRVVVVDKKATARRRGIDPFTKEERVFEAKPATRKVRLRPAKALREYALRR